LVDVTYDAVRRVSPHAFVVIGATASHPSSLYHIFISQGISKTTSSMLATSLRLEDVPLPILTTPQPLSFPRIQGPYQQSLSHGFIMRPISKNNRAPPHTLPPLIIAIHGGPTSCFRPSVHLEFQYYSSRGYVVALLNHAGSIGYGRVYREQLSGQWGVADTADAASCAAHLGASGLVDPTRIGI